MHRNRHFAIMRYKNVPLSTSIFHLSSRLGEVVRFLGKFSGILNGVDLQDLRLDLIAMSRDGRVYVVIRRPPTSLAHSIKILTPFADAVGWMYGVSKVKGVPNGLNVLGTKLIRNMVVSFDSGNFVLKCRSSSCFTPQTIIVQSGSNILFTSGMLKQILRQIMLRHMCLITAFNDTVLFLFNQKARNYV